MFDIPFMSKFPVQVVLLKKYGNGHIVTLDRARYVKDKSFNYYQLKSNGYIFKPCTLDDMAITNRGKPFLILYEYQREQYAPVDIKNLETVYDRQKNGELIMECHTHECVNGHTFVIVSEDENLDKCPFCKSHVHEMAEPRYLPKIKNVIGLKSVDEDMVLWRILRMRLAEERHKNKSWWAQNTHFVMFAMTFVLMIVLAYLFMGSVTQSTLDVTNALNALQGKITLTPPPG